MIERDDLVATYSVDYVAGVMSLRKPQKESLIRLEKIWNAADIRKGADRGMTAFNDLKLILGFELTATPKTNKNGNIYLVEIKRHDQLEGDDVKAKRERAVTYCQKATTWANANGYKPWTHLFIPDNEVRPERLLADYVKMFSC